MARCLKHLLALMCIGLISVANLSSQSLSTKGTDFYFTFMQNSGVPEMWVFISADAATSAQIYLGTTLLTTVNIAAGNAVSYRVTNLNAYQQTSGLVRANSAVRVVSVLPVTVYAFNTLNTSTDACIVLPKNVLADEYIVASQKFSEFGPFRSQVAVVGTDNGTIVQITPRSPVVTPSGTLSAPFQITLNAGDVYQFQSHGNGTDLTGTQIRVLTNSGPCGRVAVFSGHQRTALPTENNNYRDHLFEQMPPVRTLGKSFIVPPIFTSLRYDIRVIASEPSTLVTINGTTHTLATIGSYLTQNIGGTQHLVISSNKPILVAQYALSTGVGFNNAGDPFMMVVPPIEQRIDRFTFNAFVPPTAGNIALWRANLYVNILSRTVDLDQIRFDNVPISVLRTRTTPPYVRVVNNVAGGMSYACVQVTEGVHVVDASLGDGAIGLIYGLASADSYGFAGGTSVNNLRAYARIVDTLACPDRPTLLEAFSLDSSSVTTYQWFFPFDGTSLTGKRVQKSFPDTGTYIVSLNLLKGGCTLDTIKTELHIETPVKPVLVANRSPECWNVPINISARVTGGVGPYTYQWEGMTQNGIVSGATDSVVVVRHANGGTFTYRVTVTDQQGCIARRSIDIVVRPGPTVDTSPDILVCKGDTATITALTTGEYEYLWSPSTPAIDSTIIGSRVQRSMRMTSDILGFHIYRVRVTDNNGCITNRDYRVEVIGKPTVTNLGSDPVIQCLEDSVPPITIGDSLVISGGLPPYTYSWSEEGGGTSSITGSTTSAITTVKPAFTTTYVLTVRDSEGRISCPVQIKLRVEVRLVPDAQAGVDRIICVCSNVNGASIGENALCGRPPYQYSWSPNLNLSNPTSNVTGVTLANPPQTTTYVITVQDADGGVNSDTVVVFVEPCPTVVVPDVTMCDGTTQSLLVPEVTVVDPNVCTYSWSPTSFLSDPTVANPTVFAQDSTYETVYTLTVTSDKGCVGTTTVTVRRSFDLRSIASATPECSVDTICRGDTVQLRAEGLGGQGPYRYSWTAIPADPTIDAQGDGTARAQPLSTTTYTAIVQDAFGCEASNIVMVCVDPVPNAFAGEDTLICASDAGVIPVMRGRESSCGKLPFVYEWTPSANVDIPNASQPWRAGLRPTTTTSFILKVTDDGGAGATTLDTVVVNVRAPIIITFTPDTVDICKGLPEQLLTAIASDGNAPYTYEWIIDGTVIVTDVTSAPTVFPSNAIAEFQQTTVILLRATDSLGCVGEDSIRVVVREAPVVEPQKYYRICPCDSVQIGALATGGTPFTDGSYRYKWSEINENDPGASSISNDTLAQPFVHPRSTTEYSVVVVDSAGCVSQPAFVTVEVAIPGAGTIIKPADIIADPHSSSVPIDITTVVGDDTLECVPDRLEFSVTYDERLYEPFPTLSVGTITGNAVSVLNGVPLRTLTIRIVPPPQLTMGTPVTTIKGRALVGEPGSTSIVISDVGMVWPCARLPLGTQEGTLTLDSLCEKPDGTKRLLSYGTSAVERIEPNPTDGSVSFVVRRASMRACELMIVNEIGSVVATIDVPGSPVPESTTITIPARLEVPNGVYRAVLRSDTGVSVNSFMVIK